MLLLTSPGYLKYTLQQYTTWIYDYICKFCIYIYIYICIYIYDIERERYWDTIYIYIYITFLGNFYNSMLLTLRITLNSSPGLLPLLLVLEAIQAFKVTSWDSDSSKATCETTNKQKKQATMIIIISIISIIIIIIIIIISSSSIIININNHSSKNNNNHKSKQVTFPSSYVLWGRFFSSMKSRSLFWDWIL